MAATCVNVEFEEGYEGGACMTEAVADTKL